MMVKQNRGRQWLEWRRRILIATQMIGAGGCVWLLVALFSGEMGLTRYLSMRDHARNLEQELSALHRENALLQRDITRLQHDPAKIEQLAREQLGYVRKGETVYQLAPDPEKTPQPFSKP
ncbi:MAG: septum formation initiator family protein [Nitrospira sp. LK70]|nr:septum formation initiator family protein [Nitrospira sp. LK70]